MLVRSMPLQKISALNYGRLSESKKKVEKQPFIWLVARAPNYPLFRKGKVRLSSIFRRVVLETS